MDNTDCSELAVADLPQDLRRVSVAKPLRVNLFP